MPFLPESAEADLLTWARGLVERKAYVLHAGLGIVGQAARLWPAGEYFNPDNGRHVTKPVLTLEDGNAFVLRVDENGTIVELTSAEVEVHERLVSDLGIVLTGAIVEMNNRTEDKTRLPIALSVLGAALAAQLRALRTVKG